jgi:hypothetical protein
MSQPRHEWSVNRRLMRRRWVVSCRTHLWSVVVNDVTEIDPALWSHYEACEAVQDVEPGPVR